MGWRGSNLVLPGQRDTTKVSLNLIVLAIKLGQSNNSYAHKKCLKIRETNNANRALVVTRTFYSLHYIAEKIKIRKEIECDVSLSFFFSFLLGERGTWSHWDPGGGPQHWGKHIFIFMLLYL